MSTELVRYRCPKCKLTFDVYHEDGEPERLPVCPNCKANKRYIMGKPDKEETELFGG